MTKETKPEKLTMKEQGFVKDLIETKNGTESIKRNYNLGSKNGSKTLEQMDNVAGAMAHEKLRKPKIQYYITLALKKQGISNAKIVRIMNEILTEGKEENKIKILDQLHKILGSYAPEKHEFTGLIGILGSVKESEKEPIKE